MKKAKFSAVLILATALLLNMTAFAASPFTKDELTNTSDYDFFTLKTGDLNIDENSLIWDSPEGIPEEKDYTDETEFKRLKGYGIIEGDENGSLNLDAPVTRAEMAQFIANAAALKSISAQSLSVEKFSDVDETHWAYDAIHVLKSMNYIDGNGDGTFSPDDTVTYEQAVKMLVNILGYTPIAEVKGGYPNGYIEAASRIGLTQNIKFNPGDNALRRDIAIMLDTALDIPIMEQFSFGSEAEYRILNGENDTELVTLKNELEYK